MSRRAYESVVKSESHTVLGGKMGVNDIAMELVCASESGKQSLRLNCKVVHSADVDKPFGGELGGFLVIAEDSAAFLALSCL